MVAWHPMPVTYALVGERGLVRTSCVGYVTFDDVMKHFQILEDDPRRVGRLNVLLDLRSTTSIPTTGQLRKTADRIHRTESALQFGACAIVATDIVQTATGKMFAALARDLFTATIVVETIAEAEAWLASR